MITRSTLSGTLLCIVLLAAGCGSPSSSTGKSSVEPPSPAAEPANAVTTAPTLAEDASVETPASAPEAVAVASAPPPAAVPAATTTTKPPVAAPAEVAAKPPALALAAATPAPAPKAASPAPVATASPSAAAPVATSAIADPGGTVAVAATKPGLERIGAEDCGNCHDVQFESWTDGAHARRTPPLDCEHCHGPGSEYKSKAVMKDPVKAKAAGLVMPDKAFCGKCHKKGVDDAFMEKAHAHDE